MISLYALLSEKKEEKKVWQTSQGVRRHCKLLLNSFLCLLLASDISLAPSLTSSSTRRVHVYVTLSIYIYLFNIYKEREVEKFLSQLLLHFNPILLLFSRLCLAPHYSWYRRASFSPLLHFRRELKGSIHPLRRRRKTLVHFDALLDVE